MHPHLRPQSIENCVLDERFNNPHYVVYSSHGAAELVFRGTHNADDLSANLVIAGNTDFSGTWGSPLHAQRPFRTVCRAVHGFTAAFPPTTQLRVAGHSLGGTKAMLAALAAPRIQAGDLFNPGAGFNSSAGQWLEAAGLISIAALIASMGMGALRFPLTFGVVASALLAPIAAAESVLQEFAEQSAAGRHERIRVHHVWGDPISANFPLGTLFTYKAKGAGERGEPVPFKVAGGGAHALGNFL